jgi:hypothetical protein
MKRNAKSQSTDLRSRRELAHRSNGGVDVTLFWHSQTDELLVCVSDARRGAYFEIRPERDLALDAFNHPYAYCGDDLAA